MQRLSFPGSTHISDTWTPTRPLSPWREAALLLALAGWRLWWNLAHPRDLFLDSWVLVHLMRVLEGSTGLLPRGVLTLHYPLSYLPFWPAALLMGPVAAVKLAYPLVTALAAFPAYWLAQSAAGAAAILLLPDLAAKSLTDTPQAAALPLFLLALHCALQGRRLPFLLAATAVLFTHQLTGMVTLVLYAAVVAFPGCREPGFLRSEWPYLAYFAAWPLYWTWSFANTQQAYLGPALLALALGVGLPLALLVYAAAPLIDRAVQALGRRVAALSLAWMAGSAALAAAAVAVVTFLLVRAPGLQDAPVANRAILFIYGIVLAAGLAAALARRHTPLALFMGTLLALGFVNNVLGCAPFFDGLRVADYATAAGLVALFAPGLPARWALRSLLLGLTLLVALATGLRLYGSHERLFAHSDGQLAAARWVAQNLPPDASVATDAKMSLLILGEGSRNATFEGTWWLFADAPVAPYVAALNGGERFRDRPIQYVLLDDYMFRRGAEVTWFSPPLRAPPSLPARLEAVGRQIYAAAGVSIWALDAAAVAAVATEERKVDFVAGLASGLRGGPCR